jgi:hypothetical protein
LLSASEPISETMVAVAALVVESVLVLMRGSPP